MLACWGVEIGECFATTVDYCGVVTVTEQVSDCLEWELGVFPKEIHSYMTGFGDRLDAAGADEGLRGRVEVAGDALDDGVRAGR